MKKIAKFDFKIGKNTFKLISIKIGSDESLYIICPMKVNGGFNYFKFTYHSDGKSHIKALGRKNKEKIYRKFPSNIPMKEIGEILNTNFFINLKDFKTINFKEIEFSDGEGQKKYVFYNVLDSKKYQDALLKFFLCPKSKKNVQKSKNNYRKIFRLEFSDSLDLIMTIEDKWLGR